MKVSVPFLLKLAVSTVFLARGWLTYRWDSPIRGLLWNETWMTPILSRFGVSWEQFAAGSDAGISTGLHIAGIALMLSAALPFFFRSNQGNQRLLFAAMLPAVALLCIDSFARWSAKDFELGMGLEHALQWGAPMVLFCFFFRFEKAPIWRSLLMIFAAATFIGHGLYALGFHPVPLQFQTMTGSLTGLGETGTLRFLLAAGILDVLAAGALLVPRLRRPALVYMVLWGAATALARPLANPGFDPWIAEGLVRTAHWLLPLVAFLSLGLDASEKKTKAEAF